MKDNVKNWSKGLEKGDVLWGIGGIIVILIFLGYVFEYKPENVFLLGKSGTLALELPLVQTNIFIDEEKKLTTTKENENPEFELSAKKHSVIISRDGYYPWTKEVIIPNNGKIKLSPIFITINTSGQIITKNDPEYVKLRRIVIENPLPAKTSPIISKDGIASLWMEDNKIIVSVASSTYNVLQPDTAIRSVHFYKDRADVVIFSTSSAIYAIEVNKEGKQNFMPIYKGGSPTFYKDNPNFVYVWDNGTLMEVII
ncbi:MAG: hypothetical protein EXS47_02150 [Candidatus Zambryskibacteria bacterium]|nr:hypothetical protein [Candidatus Zambryskibacteria bacterium]